MFRRVAPCIAVKLLFIGLRYQARAYSARTCPDLRILFCGSDNFSVSSLRALVDAKTNGQLPIQSLDVVCRPPKRAGRGLRQSKQVPIISASNSLGLPVHQIDGFQEWSLPSELGINLIIAVSFGLLVPMHVIKGARYGGLNVHPSILPDFRGAAPVEHALLEECNETGVSLQTLHPYKFDHGHVLRQERFGLDSCNDDLQVIKHKLGEQGARLLIAGLAAGDFLEPVQPLASPATYSDGSPVQQRKASKIVVDDMHLKWKVWTSTQILTRQKVLGPLWSILVYRAADGGIVETRVKWSGGFKLYTQKARHVSDAPPPHGARPRFLLDTQSGSLVYSTSNGSEVSIDRFTLAGRKEMSAREAHDYFKLSEESSIDFR